MTTLVIRHLLLGENVLHMAIVNEDPSMVRFLLDNGVNCLEACNGNFFTPEDQGLIGLHQPLVGIILSISCCDSYN